MSMKKIFLSKQNFKNLIKKLFMIFPIRNIIVMESNPDFTDNTKLVFDKLIENKVNEKYKIVWFVKDSKKFTEINIRNVKFISVYSKYNIFKKIRKLCYISCAKIIIDSNNYVPKIKKEQFRLHLTHGTLLKKISNYCEEVGNVDFILELSDYFKNETAKLFKKDKECFLELGFPRNDDIFSKIKIENIFPEYTKEKMIVWLPTYREHKEDNKHKHTYFKYGVPCVKSKEDFKKIDKILKENNIIIIIKLHPAQATHFIETINLTNIRFITDKELNEKKLNLYKLLSVSDGLITDYSSVYYDYLLTKKPIALAIEDIEEYKENVGFIYDYYDTIKGEYVYNLEQLCDFIKDIANGKDKKLNERLNCLKLYHKYHDNKSSERVYEFIKQYL